MKFLSIKVHSILDYSMGILLLAGPYLFGFDGSDDPSLVLYAAGAAVLLYSLLTRYELGLIKVLPVRVHLALDVLSGILLAASPWLFGFSDKVFLPHFILGVTEILVASVTTTGKPTEDIVEVER